MGKTRKITEKPMSLEEPLSAMRDEHVDKSLPPQQIQKSEFDFLCNQLQILQTGQNELKITLEQKIDSTFDRLKKDLTTEFTKVLDMRHKALRDEVYNSIGELDQRLTTTECRLRSAGIQDMSPFSNHSLCMIAQGVKYEDNEQVLDKAVLIVNALGDIGDFRILGAMRLNNRDSRFPPLLKIAFASESQKVNALRASARLSESRDFSGVRLRSSKSHAERLIENNCNALLRMIPAGDQFRVTRHGKIVAKDNNQQQLPRNGAPMQRQLPGQNRQMPPVPVPVTSVAGQVSAPQGGAIPRTAIPLQPSGAPRMAGPSPLNTQQRQPVSYGTTGTSGPPLGPFPPLPSQRPLLQASTPANANQYRLPQEQRGKPPRRYPIRSHDGSISSPLPQAAGGGASPPLMSRDHELASPSTDRHGLSLAMAS